MNQQQEMDKRVLDEFFKKPWRWEEHNETNKNTINCVSGYMHSKFTGSVTLHFNDGECTRIEPKEKPKESKDFHGLFADIRAKFNKPSMK